MAITLARLSSAYQQATGYDALPEGSLLVDLVNEAHMAWVAEASWGYLRGRQYTTTTVVGQADYVLPAHVLEVRHGWLGNNETGRLRFLDGDEFERRLGTAYTIPNAYPWATVRWEASTAADGEPRPTLTIYPAPSTAQTLTLVYRKGVERIESESAVLDLPLPLEPSFLEWFRAYARGVTLRDTDLVTELARIRMSPMFRSALQQQALQRDVMVAPGNVGHSVALEGLDFRGDDYEPIRRY